MNIEEHAKKFREIVEKYGFDEESKAEDLSNFLLKEKTVNAKDFAKLFAMEESDAQIFLSFIAKGIHYKQHHMK